MGLPSGASSVIARSITSGANVDTWRGGVRSGDRRTGLPLRFGLPPPTAALRVLANALLAAELGVEFGDDADPLAVDLGHGPVERVAIDQVIRLAFGAVDLLADLGGHPMQICAWSAACSCACAELGGRCL